MGGTAGRVSILFHQLPQSFDSNVKQKTHVGNGQAGDFRNVAIAQIILKFQPDDFLLIVRQDIQQFDYPGCGVLQNCCFVWPGCGTRIGVIKFC